MACTCVQGAASCWTNKSPAQLDGAVEAPFAEAPLPTLLGSLRSSMRGGAGREALLKQKMGFPGQARFSGNADIVEQGPTNTPASSSISERVLETPVAVSAVASSKAVSPERFAGSSKAGSSERSAGSSKADSSELSTVGQGAQRSPSSSSSAPGVMAAPVPSESLRQALVLYSPPSSQAVPVAERALEASHVLARRALKASQVLGREALERGKDASIVVAQATQEAAIRSVPHMLGAADGVRHVAVVAAHRLAEQVAECYYSSGGNGECSDDEDDGDEEEKEEQGGNETAVHIALPVRPGSELRRDALRPPPLTHAVSQVNLANAPWSYHAWSPLNQLPPVTVSPQSMQLPSATHVVLPQVQHVHSVMGSSGSGVFQPMSGQVSAATPALVRGHTTVQLRQLSPSRVRRCVRSEASSPDKSPTSA